MIRTCIPAILGLLLSAQLLRAQEGNANLLVQSPDGKKVMLIWFLKSWNNEITGFDIRRKDGLDNWKKLNNEAILPGISMKKNLSVVESDKSEENKLKAKLYKLLATRKLKETDGPAFLQKMAADEKALHDMSDMMAQDYDLALMNGFAFVDHTVTKKTDYQYGLFIQGTDILLAKAQWNYGEIPDLNTVTEITSRATTKNKGIQLIWNADLNKMKAADVAGFNIYRQGLRLNDNPVTMANPNDPSEFTWNDRSANSAEPIQYSIGAESIFGIEGIIRSYTYNPADHPGEYKKAEVTDVTAMGYYFKEGINVKWAFPKEYERFIKGFYVEKNSLPGHYQRVSGLLDASVRAYTDRTPSSVSSYMGFRIVALYNDRSFVNGIERVYNYFPITEPPAPQGLRATIGMSNKKIAVHLEWDPPMRGDTMTNDYTVYGSEPTSEKFSVINQDHRQRINDYTFYFDPRNKGTYRFYVSATSKAGSESAYSDTVSVQTPPVALQVPSITRVTSDSGRVTIQWRYNNPEDIKGFRLFQSRKPVAGENELKNNAREYTTPKYEAGTYSFTIQAVATDGTLSEMSRPMSITIQ